MHIPDGFLDMKTAVSAGVLSAGAVGISLRRLKRTIPPRQIPMMGLSAAFIFAAQMINFPVAGGTSGHLLGGVLAAVLLGPGAAVIVMSTVIIVQCFLFADGGVLALGANIFNMAVVAPLTGFLLYRLAAGVIRGLRGRLIAAGVAAWVSTVAAAVCASGELAWSGTAPWSVAFPAMFHIHMLIGVGEGAITMVVLSAILASRPELVASGARGERSDIIAFVGYGLIVVAGLLVFVVPFASPWPDGLERVAALAGFDSKAVAPAGTSPLESYRFPGVHSLAASTIMSGAVGVIVVFVLAYVLSRSLIGGGRTIDPSSK